MIIDTSALIAILCQESEAALFRGLIIDSEIIRMSSANYLEAGIICDNNYPPTFGQEMDAYLNSINAIIEPVTKGHVLIARKAYLKYRKGNHPAKLNYGDCFAYALAKAAKEPLLFKGNDFSKTDILAAA